MELKRYIVKPGKTFRMEDGVLKGSGEEITLPSDVAAMHANSVEEIDTEEAQATQPMPLGDHPESAA